MHFWEEAILLSVREEVKKTLNRMQKPGQKEFNVAYQNICFGQLGSFALNMHNFGVSQEETEDFIYKMCLVIHLPDQMREMLLENSRSAVEK